MSMHRRRFLKIAGLSTAMGLGGAAALRGRGLAQAQRTLQSEDALQAEQFAMVIDVMKLQSPLAYKKCIDACHNTHNVPDFSGTKDEVKWLWKDTFERTFPTSGHHYMEETIDHKPFLLLCNHCENPPCVRVCPTKATYKNSQGVVVVDFHRCIGCRFCMAACPFGARSFNWRDPRKFFEATGKKPNPEYPTRTIGVVEKCNFCVERLAIGLEPACVEASEGALVFGDLRDTNSEVREILRGHYAIVRKPELGTRPCVYYVIGGRENA